MAGRDKAIILLDGALEAKRLAKDLDGKLPVEEVQDLYSGFLFDLMSQLVNLSSTSILLFSENYLDRNRWFGGFGSKAELRLLTTEDDANFNIAESVFSEGYRRLVFVNCFNPIAPLREIQVAFQLLQLEDDIVVLGPTDERSWYLVSIKNLHAAPLRHLYAGSHDGLDDIIKAICSVDVLTFTVQPRYAVNSISNMARLRKEIESQVVGNQPFPHKTRERLFQLERKYGLLKRG
jgi:hypothetical protein